MWTVLCSGQIAMQKLKFPVKIISSYTYNKCNKYFGVYLVESLEKVFLIGRVLV